MPDLGFLSIFCMNAKNNANSKDIQYITLCLFVKLQSFITQLLIMKDFIHVHSTWQFLNIASLFTADFISFSCVPYTILHLPLFIVPICPLLLYCIALFCIFVKLARQNLLSKMQRKAV